ncbi:alpha/beta fold hydrolase [uncultured Tessaracoccus sp.]|uniref:alpha/beta fold hydrolase n=1 Tax=uncultured Tessaracoccus sp. TaxID=905023 RepID=UPI00260BD02C|nr:alpha/beta hydrolase [uncultured Tessaracoccus sp.]
MELTWHTYNPESDADRLLIVAGSLGGDTAHQWNQVAGHLAKDAVVVFCYLPGQGMGAPWSEAMEPTMEALATALAETVEDIIKHFPDRATIFAGLSLSGALGLYLARDHSDLLEGVVVVASAATIGTPETWLERAELVERDGTASLVTSTQDRWFTPDFVAEEPGKVAAIMEGLAASDDYSYAQLCRCLATYDFRGDLHKLYTPIMLISGEKDESHPIADLELVLESAPGADMRIVPDVAHQVTVAAPGTVADIIRGFFRRLRQQHWSVYDITDGDTRLGH